MLKNWKLCEVYNPELLNDKMKMVYPFLLKLIPKKWFKLVEFGFTSKPSSIQQFGRVGRHDPGLVITLIKEFGEIDLSDNVSAAMVKATFDGDTKQINEKEYKQIYDIGILRGALSYPDPKTF